MYVLSIRNQQWNVVGMQLVSTIISFTLWLFASKIATLSFCTRIYSVNINSITIGSGRAQIDLRSL